MNAKTSEVERLSAELYEAQRALQELRASPAQAEVLALESAISDTAPLPLPPVELRLHIGTKASAANFLRQGSESSRKVLSLFGETPSGPILDWGCGSGRTLRWLLNYRGWREFYRGTDVDAEAIAWLQKHKITANVCTTTLPYETGEMAGIFSFSVLTHIHPQYFQKWFFELARVLKHGGLAYLTFNGDSICESKEERHQPAIADFRTNGWAWLENEGHFKSASFVKHAFVERAASGIFNIRKIVRRDYGPMDAVYAEKI